MEIKHSSVATLVLTRARVAESVGAIQNGRGGRDMRLERRSICAVRLVAHGIHGRPFRIVVYECDVVERTTYRRNVDRTKNIGVHEVENSS